MIIQFLQSIGELISSLLGMLFNMFTMLLMLLTAIPRAIAYVVGVIGYMPAFVGSVILVSVGIAVITTVINHWGNV